MFVCISRRFIVSAPPLAPRSYGSQGECKSRAASLTTATYYPLNVCSGYSMYASCSGECYYARVHSFF